MRVLAHTNVGLREFKDIVVVDGEVQLHRYRVEPPAYQLEKHYGGEWHVVPEWTNHIDFPPTETFGRCTVDVGHSRPGTSPAVTTPNGGPE